MDMKKKHISMPSLVGFRLQKRAKRRGRFWIYTRGNSWDIFSIFDAIGNPGAGSPSHLFRFSVVFPFLKIYRDLKKFKLDEISRKFVSCFVLTIFEILYDLSKGCVILFTIFRLETITNQIFEKHLENFPILKNSVLWSILSLFRPWKLKGNR